jgi:diguanylate cyclase (GGDEF)-like protein
MEDSHHEDELKEQLIGKLRCYQNLENTFSSGYRQEQSPEGDSYAQLMKIFCEIEMTDEEAKYHFHRIVEHTRSLEHHLNRKTGVLVGMLDYLLNINPRLDCPKFIELSKFQTLLAQSALDPLTGLYNRRYFDIQFTKELHRCKRYNTTFSIALIDIDDFKLINDAYGHNVGDCVLKEFSFLLKKQLRSEDIASRYGGEEFVILFPHTEIEGAKTVTERFLQEIAAHHFTKEISITFSGGIANFPTHADTRKELIDIADRGMYRAKQQGKNRISVLPGERRDNKRYETDAGLLFTARERTQYVARMRNVSLTGLAAETHADLQPGEVIRLQFQLEEDTQYDLQAQIIWVDKSTRDTGLYFGARYDQHDYDLINRIVSQYQQDQNNGEYDQPTLF